MPRPTRVQNVSASCESGRACPGHLSRQSGGRDGPDKPGHDVGNRERFCSHGENAAATMLWREEGKTAQVQYKCSDSPEDGGGFPVENEYARRAGAGCPRHPATHALHRRLTTLPTRRSASMPPGQPATAAVSAGGAVHDPACHCRRTGEDRLTPHPRSIAAT